jgi:hypothetical protein
MYQKELAGKKRQKHAHSKMSWNLLSDGAEKRLAGLGLVLQLLLDRGLSHNGDAVVADGVEEVDSFR